MNGYNSALSRSLGPSALGVASREMDNLFDRLFHAGSNGSATQKWMPPMSVWEEGDHYYLELDLPGFADDEIDVTFEEGRLKISAKRSRDDVQGRNYLHDERWWGEVTRVISIPDSIDAESIMANYDEGVLRLQCTKRPEVMPKKIAIKTK